MLASTLIGRRIVMIRSGLVALSLIAVVSTAPRAEAAADDAARKFIQELADKAVGVAKEVKAKPDAKDELFRGLLRDGFDIETIGRFVLGRNWQSATDDERKRFMDLFNQMLLDTYATRLTDYAGETVDIKATRAEADGATVVQTEIARAGQAPTRVDWKVRDPESAPKIVDVFVEGVSMAITQRSDFNAVIKNKGGVSGLNETLAQKLKR